MAFVRSYDTKASCADTVKLFLARIARAVAGEGGGVVTPPPTPPPGGTVIARPVPPPAAPPLATVAQSAGLQQNIATAQMFVEATIPGDVFYQISVAHKDGNPASGFAIVPVGPTVVAFAFDGKAVGDGNPTYPAITAGDRVRMLIGIDGVTLYKNDITFASFDASPTSTVKLSDGRLLRDVVAEVISDPTRVFGTARANGANVLTNIKMGAYAKTYPPVAITSIEVAPSGVITATIDYYSNDPASIILSAYDGQRVLIPESAMLIVENVTPGRAIVRSPAALPVSQRGAPAQARISLATGGAFAQTAVVWAAPISFGFNPTPTTIFYLAAPTADKLTGIWSPDVTSRPEDDYKGPNSSTPQTTFDGNVLEGSWAAGAKLATLISPPAVNGQRRRIIWRGKAKDPYFVSSGGGFADANAGNVARGSNSTHQWIDFDHNFDAARLFANGAGFVQLYFRCTPDGTGADWPTDFHCYDINADGSRQSPGYWDARYMADYRLFGRGDARNPFRTMDFQNIVDISHIVIDTPSQPGDKRRYSRHSIPDILDLLDATSLTAKFYVPMRATETYIRTEARRTAKWAKRTGKRVQWALSNETWNVGQNAYRIAQQDAATRLNLYPGDGGKTANDVAIRYVSFRHKEVMTWIRQEFEAEGVASLLICSMEVQNDNPGNNVNYLEEPGVVDFIDRWETAPYVGGGLAAKPTSLLVNGAYDHDEFERRVRAQIPGVHAKSAVHRDFALAHGMSYGTYEGGYEDTEDRAFWQQFETTSQAYSLTTFILQDWEQRVGSQYTWYNDYRVDKHGYARHISQAVEPLQSGVAHSMIRKALFDYMNAVAARA